MQDITIVCYISINIVEQHRQHLEWKLGIYQEDNNPEKEQKTTQGHQCVFESSIEYVNVVPSNIIFYRR